MLRLAFLLVLRAILLLQLSSFCGMACGSNSSDTFFNVAKEEVDLIELNHFHDCLGRHVYDQVIFYEWSEGLSEYHVRAWCLVEDREPISRRPTRTYTDNRYHVRWHDRDQNLQRTISSIHFRESWTQVDPERANKKLLDERLRTSLVKRRLELKPSQTLPSLEPEPLQLILANGEENQNEILPPNTPPNIRRFGAQVQEQQEILP